MGGEEGRVRHKVGKGGDASKPLWRMMKLSTSRAEKGRGFAVPPALEVCGGRTGRLSSPPLAARVPDLAMELAKPAFGFVFGGAGSEPGSGWSLAMVAVVFF